MLLLKGIKFNPNTSFEVDGVQYPANWFQTASQEEKDALGITEVADQARPDDRFFYIQENSDGTFTSTPKDLAPIKEQFKNDIDTTCGNIRLKYISKGDLVTEEYRRAYDEAVQFKAANYTGNVPSSIQVWASLKDQTPEWAADDIIATGTQYYSVLDQVRAERLTAKFNIDAAQNPAEILNAMNVFHTAVDGL